MYIRFQTPEGEGLFATAYRLRETETLTDHERRQISRFIEWLEDHLRPVPWRIYRVHPEGAVRCWFKPAARDHVQTAWELLGEMERLGVALEMHHEAEPGPVVFEDRHQIAVLCPAESGPPDTPRLRWDRRDRATLRGRLC